MSDNKVKEKKWFDVKVEANIPALLTFRIFAEDAEQAANLIKDKAPTHIQYKLHNRKSLLLRVYDAGSVMLRFTKRLLG
jgi:histidinol dehydrogenase